MKNLIFAILALLFIGCKPNSTPVNSHTAPVESFSTPVSDSTDYFKNKYLTEINYRTQDYELSQAKIKFLENKNELLTKTTDSLKTANNLLGKRLLKSEFVLTNARYYLNIANKNASQQKFLRGWMNRALNQ